MPELPEVETIARGLAKRVVGDVIESVWLGSKPEPLKSSAAEIAAALQSRKISDVRRVGKHIVLDLAGENGDARSAQWIVHLGMTGSLLVCSPESELAKHTHAVIRLASGRELRFVDPRRFGRLSVIEKFKAPGAEPLQVSLENFVALFRAGIRSRRRAASLSYDELARLHKSLKRVLREAIRLGGSSISDYVDADGDEGFFQLKHRVYGREGKPCLVCKTPVKRVVIGGRSSHYCPKCQK